MRESYWKLRERMLTAGLWPQGWIARGACYSLGLAIGLLALEMLLKLFAPKWSDSLGGWVKFLLFDAAVLFSVVAFRGLKRKVLWRLRNRLIVTYVFIGVIPAALLVAMAFITIYLFAGQFASFVVTSDINSQLRSMQAVNAAVSNELAARIEKGQAPTAESLAGLKKRDRAWRRREVTAWQGAKILPLTATQNASLAFPDFIDKDGNPYAKAIGEGQPFKEIVRDKDELFLRVVSRFDVGREKLTVVCSEPLDKTLLSDIAANLGEITLYAAGITLEEGHDEQNRRKANNGDPKADVSVGPEKNSGGIVLRERKSGASVDTQDQVLHPTFSVGALSAPTGVTDREITFGTPLQVLDWKTGDIAPTGALVSVHTRPSVLYSHLFAALGDIARGVEYILLAILIFFAVIELVALIIGTRMTQTVTGAVAQLYDATRNVDRGDFSHRIPVKSADQLAQLSLSFNSMTESIEKLILEQKEKQRLEGELAIAQEVQAQLFPRQVSELESLEVHGFCRPARTVSGDYYDFLTASSHKLILAVGDISGKGISAALLMATLHSAVRAYRFASEELIFAETNLAGLTASREEYGRDCDELFQSPGRILSLLNRHLYRSTQPEKYATLFLAHYNAASARLTYSNAGQLPPLVLGQDGSIRRLDQGGTVVGLMDGMHYDEDSFHMQPGDILVAYSDGVTEPENDFGEFGEERMMEVVSRYRDQPLHVISTQVMLALDAWIGAEEQPDDITLVLARQA